MTTEDFVSPGMREQLDAPSFQGLATFGMQPFVADAKDLDTIKPDIGVVGAPGIAAPLIVPERALVPEHCEPTPTTLVPTTWTWESKSLTTSVWLISETPS